jgi:hypothetical protein
MRTSPFLFFFLLPILFTQCTKDRYDPNAPCIPHEEFTTGPNWEPIFSSETKQPIRFSFNPTNPNEISFVFWERGSSGLGLFNLKTGNYRTIIDLEEGVYILDKPIWSPEGWILLNILENVGVFNLYKLDPDEAELERLTDWGFTIDPVFDITGEKIIFMVANVSPATWLVIDKEGEVLDTTYRGPSSSYSSWQHSQYIANVTSLGLMITDPYQNQSEVIYPVNSELDQSIESTVWLDEERIFWCFTTGVYITNIVTGETEVIRETCNARYYQRPTYAPDIDKIVLERCERIKDTETSGRFIVTPTMMNPDGSEEEVLEIEVD